MAIDGQERLDAAIGRIEERPCYQTCDAMTASDPFAALARKWQTLADHSPNGERVALTLMVADLWKTIDEESRP